MRVVLRMQRGGMLRMWHCVCDAVCADADALCVCVCAAVLKHHQANIVTTSHQSEELLMEPEHDWVRYEPDGPPAMPRHHVR